MGHNHAAVSGSATIRPTGRRTDRQAHGPAAGRYASMASASTS
jgi:hypothetical protein